MFKRNTVKLLRFELAAVALLVLAGCASAPELDPSELFGDRELPPFELNHDIEPFAARIMLIPGDPNLTRVEDVDTQERRGNVTTGVVYQYVGVSMGQGLFLDANLNLFFNALTLLEVDTSGNFLASLTDTGPGQSHYQFERDGPIYRARPGTPFSDSYRSTFYEDRIEVSPPGLLQGAADLFVTERRAIFDPPLFTSLTKVEIEQLRPGLYRFPANVGDTVVRFRGGGSSIQVGDLYILHHEGRRIRFEPVNIRRQPERFLFVEGNTINFIDSRGQGLTIEVSDKEVYVQNNGRSAGRFTIVR